MMTTDDLIRHIKTSPVAHRNQHLIAEEKTAKKSKYNNQKLVIDNHTFDSKREARRYIELRIMLTANLIRHLLLQVPYELNEGGTHSLKYVADFTYQDCKTGETIVEDVKGVMTQTFKKKSKLMKKIYGIDIKIT